MEAQGVLDRGRALCALQEDVPKGQWERVLEELCLCSIRTAQYYMSAWRQLGEETQRVAPLGLSSRALYLLASPSTPEDVREAVLSGQIEPSEEAIKAARGSEPSSAGHGRQPEREELSSTQKAADALRWAAFTGECPQHKAYVDYMRAPLPKWPEDRQRLVREIYRAFADILYEASEP